MNLPNKVTMGRLGVAAVYFVGLALAERKEEEFRQVAISKVALLDLCLVLFLVAALTDLLDGYLARKLGQVTQFGRLTDPFVDKIIVCGSFIFFLTARDLAPLIAAWMVVVIIAREFLVHGLRALAEMSGVPFGSQFWGKQKMLLQCVTVSCVLFYLGHLRGERWAEQAVQALIWLTVLSTVASGLAYVFAARHLFRRSDL